MAPALQKKPFPHWLKKTVIESSEFNQTKEVLRRFGLNTVCESALCPNIFECFSQRRATFLILGDRCTRGCRFCAVPVKDNDIAELRRTERGTYAEHYRNLGFDLEKPNPEEPLRIKKVVEELGLSHVVITSVTRDDLEDGGARHFSDCILTLKRASRIIIEVLVPDFKGDLGSIKMVVDAGPDIFSHNIETVPRLYSKVRPQADYQISISVLRFAKFFKKDIFVKSGIMVGLGEGLDEVVEVMDDLKRVGCDIITIGQYLRPTQANIEVLEFVEPAKFDKYSKIAEGLGFKKVISGPFVRSSYTALSIK